MPDLFGHEDNADILPPEEADKAIMETWAAFANVWKLHPEATDPERRATFYLLLEEKAQKLMNLRPKTLPGIKAKLILALCCGPDAGPFLRHYCEGLKLPELLAFRERNSSQVFDAVQAIDRLLEADRARI